MDYVLWISGAIVGVAVYAYAGTLGGYTTRNALTCGIYGHFAPTAVSYRPGSVSWAREQMLVRNPDHLVRDPGTGYADLIDYAAHDTPAPDWTATTPARGVATVPPVLDPDESVAVQHAVALDDDASYQHLADMSATGEFTGWDAFQARLLGTLNAGSGLTLTGWDTGQWTVRHP